jgi:hypothetical protein
MSETIVLPEIEEIANWHSERCEVERTRLRNELSFIHGDRAHGGPSQENMAVELKCRLAALDRRLERFSGLR